MPENLFSLNGPYARAMNWIWNMLVVSLLWVLCCIPLVTIGAATTAAYYAMAKSVRHHTGTVAAEFFAAFRREFRQATVLTLIFGLILGALLLECVYVYSDPAMPLPVLYLFYFMAAMVAACAAYVWPCLSRFAKGNAPLLRMAVILVFRHIPTTVLLLLLQAALLAGLWLMPWGILLFPGIAMYLQTFLMEKILLRYSPKPADDDPEAQKWYYQ